MITSLCAGSSAIPDGATPATCCTGIFQRGGTSPLSLMFHAQTEPLPQPAMIQPFSADTCAALPPPTCVFGPRIIDRGLTLPFAVRSNSSSAAPPFSLLPVLV